MKNWFKTGTQFLLHFWFPRTCFCCGCDLAWHMQEPLCPACTAGLKEPGPCICKRCGTVLKSGGGHCYACRGSKARAYKCGIIRSACMFNDSSRALVHALKYAGADYLARYMGLFMGKQYCRYPELAEAELAVPIPLYSKRRRKRGYNQSELLAHFFAEATGMPVDLNLLMRVRDTVSQTTLNRKERLANMAHAFACKEPNALRGKTVLLVDDVATTGATLEGCAAALKKAGAKKVFAYTFARE